MSDPVPRPVEWPNIGDTCCGQCGWGLCYVDEITGENSEGWGLR